MDIALAVVIATFTCVLAFMGVHVTLHPPTRATAKRNWKIAFWIVAFGACAAIGWQTKRNGDSQTSLQTQLGQIRSNTEKPPQVTVNIPPSPPPQITVNSNNHVHGSLSSPRIDLSPSLETKPFVVNMHMVNVGQVPIPNVYYWGIATFQPLGKLDSNSADRNAYSNFIKIGKKSVMEAKKAGHSPTYFAISDDVWASAFLQPRQEEIDGVIRGSTRLYFFLYAEWEGGSYTSCRWLQPPPDVHFGNGSNLVLHVCTW